MIMNMTAWRRLRSSGRQISLWRVRRLR